MEMRHCSAVFCVLVICAVLCVSEGQQDCKQWGECYPGLPLPKDVTRKDYDYWCCPEKNTTMNSNKTSDGTVNCTCVPDFTLDEKIQKWAEETKNAGRMCSRGAAACSGSIANSTTNHWFLQCCWPQKIHGLYVASSTTLFDGDKEEYIGCRCDFPIPTPDPTAYIVPQTSMYNSTGESCSYDKGCDAHPSLKCESSQSTFCCYGSRGILTEYDGDSLTRCTCTNQVFGEHCRSTHVPIAQTQLPCLSECSNRDDEDVCRDDHGNERCCDHNMAVRASRDNGNITDCTCTTAREKSCQLSGGTAACAVHFGILALTAALSLFGVGRLSDLIYKEIVYRET